MYNGFHCAELLCYAVTTDIIILFLYLYILKILISFSIILGITAEDSPTFNLQPFFSQTSAYIHKALKAPGMLITL